MNVMIATPPQIPKENVPTRFNRIWEDGPANSRERQQVDCFKHILVVDDDDAVRETLADLLDIDNYKTVQAVDAAQALMILLKDPAAIDILVTDLSMPGTDGITLIKHARRVKPDLPAVLLTGYAEEVSSVTMDTTNGFHVLRKPVEITNLINQITILLSQPADR